MQHKVDEAKIGPGAELRDPVRLELLRRLKGLLEDHKVARGAQASLMLCDIQYLEGLCQSFENATEEGKATMRKGLSSSMEEDEIVGKCEFEMPLFRIISVPNMSISPLAGCQKPRPSSTVSSAQARSPQPNYSEPSPRRQAMSSTEPRASGEQCLKRKRSTSRNISIDSSPSRSQLVSRMCKERDDFKCIVTKSAGPIDAAHLFPVSLNKSDDRANFFSLLKNLWAQRIGKWEGRFKNGTEFVENEVSFSLSLHRYHAKGLFALQPIEATSDGRSLKLGFYWLNKRQVERSKEMVDLMDIPALAHDFRPKDIAICSSRDEHIIRSGEVIELITKDPEKLPLPDWHILEMQWVLQRLVALKGAADIPDAVHDDSNDSDWEESTCYRYDEMEEDNDSSEEYDEHEEGWRHARIDDWVGQTPRETCV